MFKFLEQLPKFPVKPAMNLNITSIRTRARVRRFWRREIRPILILALVLFSVRSSLADWNDVPSGSMQPTILVGDRIFVNKLAYDLKVPFTTWHLAQWSNPRRGDIVVFYSPHDGTRLVKRVVGLPGDTVELRNEQLIINGSPVDYAPLSATLSDELPKAEREGNQFAEE
ncbi:MAG TPA: signal peptidase I, partial [Verrucomicrobiae bacterium]|nr:signal peptidase I [Verrucomicrobiae bacterium]